MRQNNGEPKAGNAKRKEYFIAIGNPERHVRKASYRGSKQQ